jgi:phage/conjugal plasmid C-4 type zinc finger TraR family protein
MNSAWADLLWLVCLLLFVAATTRFAAVRREYVLDDMDFAQERDARIADLLRSRPRAQRPVGTRFCTVCSEEIPEARRSAVPDCRTCIQCQMDLEASA